MPRRGEGFLVPAGRREPERLRDAQNRRPAGVSGDVDWGRVGCSGGGTSKTSPARSPPLLVGHQPSLAMRPDMGHIDPPARWDLHRRDHIGECVTGQLLARQHVGDRITTPPTDRVSLRGMHTATQVQPRNRRRMRRYSDRFPRTHRAIPGGEARTGRHRGNGHSAGTAHRLRSRIIGWITAWPRTSGGAPGPDDPPDAPPPASTTQHTPATAPSPFRPQRLGRARQQPAGHHAAPPAAGRSWSRKRWDHH